MASFLLFLLIFCCLAYRYRRTLRGAWMSLGSPVAPGYQPIVGHTLGLIGGNGEHSFELTLKLAKHSLENDGITTLWTGFLVHYVISDPEMFVTLSNKCLKKDELYRFASGFAGEGLVTASVPVWKRHRKLLIPTFNQKTLNGYLQVFNKESARVADALVSKAGTETIFGLTPNEARSFDMKYAHAIDRLFDIFFQRVNNIWTQIDFLYNFTKLKKEEEKALDIVLELTKSVIERKKNARKVKCSSDINENKFKSFLDLLLDLQEDQLLDDQEISDEVNTMVVAGYDTSSVTMLYTFTYLGAYPEVQERVYAELQEVLGDSKKEVTKEDLYRLVFTEAVIKEVLRICPTFPTVVREATEDVQLGKRTIPAGCGIMLSIWALNRNKCWGPDADQFRPERWLDPATLPDHNAFASFSVGKRACIGRTFAMMSMKTTVAHVLRRYRVKADVSNLRFKHEVLIKPISGHHISVELR